MYRGGTEGGTTEVELAAHPKSGKASFPSTPPNLLPKPARVRALLLALCVSHDHGAATGCCKEYNTPQVWHVYPLLRPWYCTPYCGLRHGFYNDNS